MDGSVSLPAGLRVGEPAMGRSIARPRLFQSFFIGGFECSTHRRHDGVRLDLLTSTQHDSRASQDYGQLAEHGIHSARDGVRWDRVETSPGRYDWSSVVPMLRAAASTGTQVAWDLCHYGWPDDLDIFSAAFVKRFARYAQAFAQLHLQEMGRACVACPVNEISFLSWAGSDQALMRPAALGRGAELKRQLVCASIAGIHAIREVSPDARILAIDPMISVVAEGSRPEADPSEVQFEAWDMLCGKREPELGGCPEMLDVVGVNYYWNNQWHADGRTLLPGDEGHTPPRELIARVHARYGRPVFLAETSIEAEARAGWLRYMGEEMRAAMSAGVPIEGIALYPVLSHPGWEDDRYCPNGLFEMTLQHGRREVHLPLAAELSRQQRLMEALFSDPG